MTVDVIPEMAKDCKLLLGQNFISFLIYCVLSEDFTELIQVLLQTSIFRIDCTLFYSMHIVLHCHPLVFHSSRRERHRSLRP